MVRLKTLPPTLRERNRYILFEVISEDKIAYEDLEQAVWNQFLDTYGELGVSKMSIWLIKNLYDEQKQTGVLKCNHVSVPHVLAGLGLIPRLGDTRVIFKILKVSGTIKGLKV